MSTSANVFYELAAVLTKVGSGGVTKSALTSLATRAQVSESRYKLVLAGKFEEAIEFLDYVPLSSDRVEKWRSLLRSVQERIHSAFSQQSSRDFLKGVGGLHVPEMIQLMGDTVAALDLDAGGPIDRPALKDETEALLEAVRSSALPDYSRRVLELKISAVHRVLLESELYTDGELRRRVKCVFADYCSEFRKFDDSCAPLSEKMHRWARRAGGAGIFALALTADASAVTALLPPPN